MDPDWLRVILAKVSEGILSVDDAFESLRKLPYENLGYARLDHHRMLRTGLPEVLFGQGKTPSQVVSIAEKFILSSGRMIATRISQECADLLLDKYPQARYFQMARILAVGDFPTPPDSPFIVIASAGTSDMPTAEEAAVTVELLGTRAARLYDVGVAGIHRLLDQVDLLRQSEVVIAVAGMEGALATVIGGLVACPVIAVPTSVGYGTSFQGLAALLSMLNSCVPGVAVVNIDNGFGAGAIAHRIAQKPYKKPDSS